jgi:hypothetical protein
MRKCMVLCAVCAVAALLASVAMADNGLLSTSKMQQMGLSGATVVSDSVAMDVRGMGTSVKAWGSSSVHVLLPAGIASGLGVELISTNGHEVAGKTSAFGYNLSFVGLATGQAEGDGTIDWAVGGGILFAGGISGGFAM